MQAKRKLLPILLVLIAAALIVTACGGGGAAGQEKTWFNLPAAPLDVNPDGTLSLYGIGLPVGAIVPPTLVQQLQSADVQQLQVRIGANGIRHLQQWPGAAVHQLEQRKRQEPGSGAERCRDHPDGHESAAHGGLGVEPQDPAGTGPAGARRAPLARRDGCTPAAGAAAGEPISLGISFDAEGNPSALGLSPEALAAIAGGALPKLDPATLQMLSTMGLNKLQISTTPTAITIMANDNQPFPSLAYDAASLQRLVDLAEANAAKHARHAGDD